jgi:hypothetical protein
MLLGAAHSLSLQVPVNLMKMRTACRTGIKNVGHNIKHTEIFNFNINIVNSRTPAQFGEFSVKRVNFQQLADSSVNFQ